MSHIFISYSTFDKEYAHELAEQAEKRGFNIWFAKHIDYSKPWTLELEQNIDTCAAFIVIMTPHAKSSKWVPRELNRADRLGKPIFAILLEGDYWIQVEDKHLLDLRPKPDENKNYRFPPSRFYLDLKRVASSAWSEFLTDEYREQKRKEYANHPRKRSTSYTTETDIPPRDPIYTRIPEWTAIVRENPNDYFPTAALSLALIDEGSNASRIDAIRWLRKAIKLEPRIKEQDWMKCQHGWGEDENNLLEQILTDPDFWDYS